MRNVSTLFYDGSLFPFTYTNIRFILKIADSTDDDVTGENYEITKPRVLDEPTKRKY